MDNKFKAVIFDLDGTLLNTLEDLADSMNAALHSFGYPSHPTEKYNYFVGDGISILAKRVLPADQQSEENIAKCIAVMLKEYGKRWAIKSKLYDGVSTLLDHLVAKGIKLAILSNKPDQFTQQTVNKFFANWPFSKVSGAKTDIPKKPSPQGAILISAEMDIPPSSFLYVGDTDTDMKTAIAAKMYPAAALWGFRSKAELQKAGAQTLLQHPLDILEFFV